MNGMNKIFILGYLGAEPKLQAAHSGSPYTALSIATHRTISKGENEVSEKHTDWHYVHVWGKQAETCVKYLTKGQPVFVEGYLTQYSVEKEDGTKERKTGVGASRVDFLPKGRRETSEFVAET